MLQNTSARMIPTPGQVDNSFREKSRSSKRILIFKRAKREGKARPCARPLHFLPDLG
jgi:hypothetical protein